MASFPSSDFTTCGVCLEPYSSSESLHIPLCLPPPCGHTFCLACCTVLIKGKRVLCPECRCSSSVNSVNDLLRNFTMMAFLDASVSQQSRAAAEEEVEEVDYRRALLRPVSNERCANHVDGCSAKASVYCQECVVYLCEECATATHKIGFMKQHKLRSMSERQVKCPKHGDMICDLVVTDGQQVICLKCHQHGKFKNKKVRPIEEVSAEVIAELKEQLPTLSSMINALTTQQSSLTEDIQSMRDNATTCRKQVKTTFQTMKEILIAKEREQQYEIEMFEHAQVQVAEEQAQANLKRTASMVELEKRVKLLASGSSDKVTLVLSFADLRAELNTQEASVTQLLNQAGASMLSVHQDVDAMRSQFSTFASLKRQTNASAQMMFTGSVSNQPLEAITPEEIQAKKLADDNSIDQMVHTIESDETLLAKAALDNNLGMVKALIKFGADLVAKNEYGWAPLHHASYRGHIEVVKVMLATEDIDVNPRSFDGDTPLYNASCAGHVKVVKLLLATEDIDVNPRDINGNTPLHVASYRGNVQVLKVLLATEGIDMNAKNKNGETALNFAISRGHNKIKALLRSAGAR